MIWRAFDRHVEPLGGRHAAEQAALQTWLYAEAHRDPEEAPAPFALERFQLYPLRLPPPPAAPDEPTPTPKPTPSRARPPVLNPPRPAGA